MNSQLLERIKELKDEPEELWELYGRLEAEITRYDNEAQYWRDKMAFWERLYHREHRGWLELWMLLQLHPEDAEYIAKMMGKYWHGNYKPDKDGHYNFRDKLSRKETIHEWEYDP